MAIVGYARVSTRDQDLAGQLAELKAAGCESVYREKASGAASDRKELARLVRKLERGDTVIVTRLDRLARSTRDLLNILDEIGKAGAGFRSIKDTWADEDYNPARQPNTPRRLRLELCKSKHSSVVLLRGSRLQRLQSRESRRPTNSALHLPFSSRLHGIGEPLARLGKPGAPTANPEAPGRTGR
jgi:hypothetical protein